MTALAPAPAATCFAINPDLDVPALAEAYRRDGRLRIFSVLSQGAVELYEHLNARDDWMHLIKTDDGALELSRSQRAAQSETERAAIDEAAWLRTREAFAYRYEALNVAPDATGEPLAGFARFLGEPATQAVLEAITGVPDLVFTDGQATAYGPGDFLTAHDDAVDGKRRVAAFVLGLTPFWRIEYGGVLLFHGESDRSVTGNVPRFNVLDLFAVPVTHSVSWVAPSAPHPRLAVTGWLSHPD